MDAGEARTRVLAQFGIRIEPAMSRYIVRQLEQPAGAAPFPIMGGDARTGVPVRRFIPPAALAGNRAAAAGSLNT